jgi:hypothetical protein
MNCLYIVTVDAILSLCDATVNLFLIIITHYQGSQLVYIG